MRKILYITNAIVLIPLYLIIGIFSISIVNWTVYFIASYVVYYILDYFISKNPASSIRARLYFSLGFYILLFLSYIGYIVSIKNGSLTDPFLIGDASGKYGYYNLAKVISHSDSWQDQLIIAGTIMQPGFPLVLGNIFKYIYNDLATGYFLMLSIGLLIIYYSSKIFSILINNKTGFAYCILLSILSPQIISQGIYIFKDGLVTLGVLFSLLGVLSAKDNKIRSLRYLLLGIVTILLFRAKLIVFVILLFLTNIKKYFFKNILIIPLVIFIIISISFLGINLKNFDLNLNVLFNFIMDNNVTNEWNNTDSGITGTIAKSILNSNPFFRILFLPVSMLVQYLLPFDIWTLNHIHPYYYIYINANIFSWLFVGPIVIYSFISLNNHSNTDSKNIFILGAFMFVLIAFTYGGVIPRYYYPFMPILIMSGSSLMANIKQKNHLYVKYIRFKKGYYIIFLFAILLYSAFSLIT